MRYWLELIRRCRSTTAHRSLIPVGLSGLIKSAPMSRLGRKRGSPSVITLADEARDQQKWRLAAGYYRKALRRKPQNAPIWVQYGHVLKAAGYLAQAERAYRTALLYEPQSADAQLQLGAV